MHKIDVNYSYFPISSTNEGILINLLHNKSINLTIDVGANNGDWLNGLRKIGYTRNVISFEPLSTEFSKLKTAAKYDNHWEVFNCAISNENKEVEINISENSVSSSLSQILNSHTDAAPESKYIEKQSVKSICLDGFKHNWVNSSNAIFLKIDVQGYEKKVLDGASKVLEKVKVLQIEMSFKKMYSHDLCFSKMKDFLEAKGFLLFHIQNGFRSRLTTELLQVDALFIRK